MHTDQLVTVEVLGPIRARVAGHEVDLGGPRQQALLAALAQRQGSTVSVDALADAVWDGDPPAAVQRTFRTYVSRLRRAIGSVDGVDPATVVRTDPAGYRLDEETVRLDADRFVELVDEARDRLGAGEVAVAVAAVDEALALWSGPAYGRFADALWARPDAVRLEELRTSARELRVQALLDAGRVDEAIAESDQLEAAHPDRESTVRLGVVARYRAGRHTEALARVRAFRERLAEETGLDPSPQFAELERMVLDQDPRLDRPVAGRRLRGYVLHEVLATTPLGSVHRAEQPSVGRDVAVTVVPAARADAPDTVRLFEARAQEVAAVEHANVVPLYDYWREPGGAFLVTRLPGGGTLSQRLARGDLTTDDALRIVRQVTGAVAAAHARGVVHGALTSDAVVLDEVGDAHLWAFSLEPPPTGVHGDLADLAALVDQLVGRVAGGDDPDPSRIAAVRAATAAVADGVDHTVRTAAGFAARLAAIVDRPGDGVGAGPPTAVPLAPGPNPYRGLAAFREVDDTVFFGRDRLARTVVGRLQRQPFVAVVGPSGSGKSSVVHAAVLPSLRRAGAFVTSMVPGTRPLSELAVALTRIAAVELPDVEDELSLGGDGLTGVLQRVLPTPEAEAVLVVDQFEELFTLSSDDERAAFLRVLRGALEHPMRRVRVVATLRADLLGRALEDQVAGALLADRVVLVEPMTADELHDVVVGPADVAGAAVEPALATAVVADAVRSPGSLPMVQFALTEVYEAAVDGTMTLDAYRRIGGIEGVLGQRAEEVYLALDEAGQRATRSLFARLVAVHGDGPATRRRARTAELTGVPAEVVDRFAAARLLRFDHDEESREPTVEVAHEALFREWPRLVTWIEEGRDDLRLLGHLMVAASDWDDGGREDAELYRGTRLDAAASFVEERPDAVAPVERAFVAASVRRREELASTTRRTVARLRALTGALALGLVVALVAGGLAVAARGDAVAARDAEALARDDLQDALDREGTLRAGAEAAATRAQVTALAAEARALAGDDVELATLLALEAYAIDPGVTGQAALLDLLGSPGAGVRFIGMRADSPAAFPADFNGRCSTVSPVGGHAVVTGHLGTEDFSVDPVAVVGHVDGTIRAVVDLEHRGWCVTPDPTGRWVLAGGPEELHAVDIETSEVVGRRAGWVYPLGEQGLTANTEVAFSPSAAEVLMLTSSGAVERLSLPDLALLGTLPVAPEGEPYINLAWDETGSAVAALTDRRIVVVGEDGTALASEPAPEPLRWTTLAGRAGLAVGASQAALYVTEATAPGELREVALAGLPVASPTVSPDGALLVVPTTEGFEVIGLPTLEPVVPPIGLDVAFGRAGWSSDTRLYWSGPGTDGLIEVDLARDLALGDRVIDAEPWQYYLGPAPDLSSVMQFTDDGAIWVSPDGTVEVPIQPGRGAAAPIPGGGWVRMDLDGRVFERGVGSEVVLSTPFPPSMPTVLPGPNTSGLRIGHGHAVMVLGDGGSDDVDPLVVAFDVEDGSLASVIAYEPDVDGRAYNASALGDDRLVVTLGSQSVEVRDHAGEVVVPATDLGFQGADVLTVSADATTIAVARNDGGIEVFDDQLGRIATLVGAPSPASSLHLTTDGRLVSRHRTGETLLWDVEQGRRVGSLFTSDEWLPFGVEVSEDGTAVLHATPRGIQAIPLSPDAWAAAACATTRRVLTQEELDVVAPGRTPADPCGIGATEASEIAGG